MRVATRLRHDVAGLAARDVLVRLIVRLVSREPNGSRATLRRLDPRTAGEQALRSFFLRKSKVLQQLFISFYRDSMVSTAQLRCLQLGSLNRIVSS